MRVNESTPRPELRQGPRKKTTLSRGRPAGAAGRRPRTSAQKKGAGGFLPRSGRRWEIGRLQNRRSPFVQDFGISRSGPRQALSGASPRRTRESGTPPSWSSVLRATHARRKPCNPRAALDRNREKPQFCAMHRTGDGVEARARVGAAPGALFSGRRHGSGSMLRPDIHRSPCAIRRFGCEKRRAPGSTGCS